MTIPTRPYIKPAAGWSEYKPRPHTWAHGQYRIAQIWHPDRCQWVLRAYLGEVVTLSGFRLVGDFDSFGAAVESCRADWVQRKQKRIAS